MYKSTQEYIADCLLATVGSYLDDNYKKYPFEEAVNSGMTECRVLSGYINFTKNTDMVYNTEPNFTEFYLQKTGRPSLSHIEASAISSIFVLRSDPSISEHLKDPGVLFKNICQATEKIRFKNSLDLLTSTADWNTADPTSWTDDYYNSLKVKTQETLGIEIDTKNTTLFAQDIAEYYRNTFKDRLTKTRRKFHWEPLDRIIVDGPSEGHGGIIAGSTGMGKSALCINILDHLIDADVPCMYFPIEMGKENSVDRIISKRTKIPYNDLINPKAENFDATMQVIEEELKRFSVHSNFAMCDDPSIDMAKLRKYVKQFQDKLESEGKDKYCVILIDLITMVSEFYMTEASMAQGIEKAINMLDILAKQLGFHYIGVVQLNRTVEQDKVTSIQSIDKLKPTRASVKNSNALLERARYMLSIFRPKYFADLYLSPEEAETIRDIAEVAIMKQNNGNVGKVLMEYNGPCFLMEEWKGELA